MSAALQEKVMEAINRLPQRRFIPDAVAQRWAEGIILLDPQRALWHVARAAGFGGSEVGELLLEKNGEPPYLNSAEDIVRDKLLLKLPTKETIYMARGTELEGLARTLFHKLMGTRSILDTPEVVASFNKSGIHPFIVGNPDEVVRRPDNGLIIPDFKVRADLDWNSKLPFVNVAQIHWYGHIYRHNCGKEPMKYALAELDIPGRLADELMATFRNPDTDPEYIVELTERTASTIAGLNMPGFGMRITSFDRNEQLEADLIETAKWFWEEHVMTGTPYVRPGTTLQQDVPDDVKDQMNNHLNVFLKAKLGNKVGESVAKDAQKSALELMRKYDFTNWPFNIPGLTHSQSQKFDVKAGATALIAKGYPADNLRKREAESLDPEKAEQTLREHGLLHPDLYKPEWNQTAVKNAIKADETLQLSQFEKSYARTALSTKKEDKEPLKTLEAAMKVHLYQFSGQHTGVVSEEPEEDDILDAGPSLA